MRTRDNGSVSVPPSKGKDFDRTRKTTLSFTNESIFMSLDRYRYRYDYEQQRIKNRLPLDDENDNEM